MDQNTFNKLLAFGIDRGVSDIHFEVGGPPRYRIKGELLKAKFEPLTADATLSIAHVLLGEREVDLSRMFAEQDTSYSIPGVSRFRVSIFRQRGTIGCVLRVIPFEVLTFDDLHWKYPLTGSDYGGLEWERGTGDFAQDDVDMEYADTVIWSTHKWLHAPLTATALLVPDTAVLERNFAPDAEYLFHPREGSLELTDDLGRYTPRVAISNNRIVSMQKDTVTFTYRDRADENKKKRMPLAATEFIRRFLLHVLPDGFVKIRYFGFLAHRNKTRCIALIRKLIDPKAEPIEKADETIADMMLRLIGIDITCCPQCGNGKMVATMPLAKIKATV